MDHWSGFYINRSNHVTNTSAFNNSMKRFIFDKLYDVGAIDVVPLATTTYP